MKLYIFSIALMASLVCQAQQDPLYSQYMFNMTTINPAYVGSRNVLSMTALHRSQWANRVEGAPRTTSFTADLPILDNKIGIGVSFVNDQIGRFNTNVFNVIAAYRLKVDRKGTLSMGLSGGINRTSAELSSINANPQGTSETLFKDYSKISPTIGAGLYYNRDRWYIGLSAPSLLNSYEGVYNENARGIRKFQHLYFATGYVFELSDQIAVKPSLMVRTAVGAPISFDLNANVWLRKIIGIGVSYRIDNAIIPMVEIQATPQFRLGYAMDYTISEYQNENGKAPVSHEFLIRYEFGFQKNKVLSPRYF